ncbi:uncharacterized protein N7482_003462 [Penicillium canariense]|uniref:Uncharacterized protein n=1 Tax=Penicillium canariense TaxID=189055 RepID=A0A9W9I6Q4_9EURO|nr:uncharacterized protein N7482_003462 [Penicillium canariense]KAJ5167868.1 hypothetical protein N7482_003462 [Penicillium canariense]
MCLSALPSLASTSLTSYLANLHLLTSQHYDHRAPPNALAVTEYPQLTPSALAFHSAVGEVIWLGVPGPS